MPEGLHGVDIARCVALLPTDATTYALTTSNTSDAIDVGRSSFGSVRLLTVTSSPTKLIAYGAENKTAASFEAIRSAGSAVEVTVSAAGWYELPSACFSVPYLQLRTDTGSATARIYIKG